MQRGSQPAVAAPVDGGGGGGGGFGVADDIDCDQRRLIATLSNAKRRRLEDIMRGRDSASAPLPHRHQNLALIGNRTQNKRSKTPRKRRAALGNGGSAGALLSPPHSSMSSQHSQHSGSNPSAAAHQSRSASNTVPITKFFPKLEEQQVLSRPSPAATAAAEDQRQQLERRKHELEQWEARLQEREQQLQQHNHTQINNEHTDRYIQSLANEVEKLKVEYNAERTRATAVIIKLLRELARRERQERNEQLMRDNANIGRRIPSRQPHLTEDTWEDGELLLRLHKHQMLLKQEKEDIELAKKLLSKKRSTARSSENVDPQSHMDLVEEEEILRFRSQMLKKEQLKLSDEEAELQFRRKAHIHFSRILEEEKRSRLSNHPVLNQRYVALQLLGKGGFSEVFKAFDLVEHQYVACKIHQLNPDWSLERRRIYTRHASREYEIHKQLKHPRVVRLYDVFAMDDTCFCTVLEYCEGSDLDMYLKQVEVVPEKSAKCIMMQIFSGLKYLNSQQRRIVHYDLKPGNILFHQGEVKIADFGLAKMLDVNDGDCMELTSPGYGTYWYLPPECFDNGHRPATISSKVDVWSAGVIFYQLLYGVRPFGHELTARKILMQKTILNANAVEFPAGKVSEECKDFIRRCLSHRAEQRPNILTIFEDDYFQRR